jgi:peptidoglycan/LPS O-acetylase OafA/YrhL
MLHNEASQTRSVYFQQLFANGWMGVDLFFVLSGFLITGILLDTRESDGYLKNFYIRRCLRIWPLYYSLLIFVLVVVPWLGPLLAHRVYERPSPWWAYPLFLQNFLVHDPSQTAEPLAVTWSLAIEEQFYLVWPWVVLYCSSSQLRRVAIWVVCLSPLLRLYLSYHDVDLYTNVFCRLDGLMAGALLALFVRSDNPARETLIKRAWILLAVTVTLACATEALHARWIVYSFSALASAAFVYLALFSGHPWLQRALTSRFLMYTGTISYGLYLLHKIPFDMARAFHFDGTPLVIPIGLAASYALATLSWNVLEKPFLRLGRAQH